MITKEPAIAANELGHAREPGLYGPIAICVALLVLCAAVFYWVPGLDLAVSGWFYAPGRGFPLDKTLPLEVIRKTGIAITSATIVGLLAIGLWWRIRPTALKQWASETPWSDWLFLSASMALGPGILVNLVMKPIWGRARPRHVEQFGGTDHFSAAWVISDQCKWGCSFVSGEAAATCLLLAFCFVVPRQWRLAMLVTGCLLTLAISMARIAVGGHFLSDVVTAWLLTMLVVLVLHAQIYHGALLGPLRRWWPAP